MNRDKYDTAEAYLSRVTQRLKAERFRIDGNITYRNQTFEYVAKRTRFEIEKFGFSTTLFLFAVFSSLDKGSLRDFSAKSFKYAGKVSIPWPRGLLYGFVCFPVAIVDTVDTDTSESIRSKGPPRHWGAAEIPVLYSLISRELYYCEVTPIWGALYYDQFRAMINYMLSP